MVKRPPPFLVFWGAFPRGARSDGLASAPAGTAFFGPGPSGGLLELAVVKLGVKAAAVHQLFVRSAFDHVAVAHDKDQIGVFDGGQAMRNDKAGASLCQLIHRPLDQKLGAGIDRRGGLVKDEHGRILQHGTCNGQQLLLPGRDAGAFGQNSVKALRQRVNKFVQSAGAAHCLQLLVGDALHIVNKVFAHRSLKQPGILQHHAEQLMHVLPAQIGNGNTVDGNGTAVQLEKAHQQVEHGRFPGAGRADDGDLLAGVYLGGKILDDDLIWRVGVAEADVLKADLTAHLGQSGRFFAFVGQLLAFEKVENAVRRGGGRLQVGHALRDLSQRRGEQADIEDKGNNDAELDGAVHGKDGTEHTDSDIGDIADDIHQRLHHAGKKLRFPVGVVNGGIELIELCADFAPGTADAHDLMAGVHLLHIAVQLAQAFLPRRKKPLRLGKDEHRQQHAVTELGKYSGKYALSELLVCDVCSGPFRRKTWTRNGVKKIY